MTEKSSFALFPQDVPPPIKEFLMKIVFQGQFLKEGLLELGHEVMPMLPQEYSDINDQIQSVCPDPDLVLLELFGQVPVPDNFYECKYKTVAYCIDTPINEYYLSNYLHLFDYVFVDQKSSIVSLKNYGITAKFLPLCASINDFREQKEKIYDISFVGTLSDYRKKRRNLLNFLTKYYSVNHVYGISVDEMQDIFAQSKIILNENFFSGLTLRIFQGLASGSLLLTESDGGFDEFFTDGLHLICYKPHSIVATFDDILHHYEKYQHIALAGQQECLARHTSKNRAQKILDEVNNQPSCKSKCLNEKKFYLANTKYTACLRFGGDFTHAVRILNELLSNRDIVSAHAAYLLGNIYIRLSREEKAVDMYLLSINKGLATYPLIKLCMIFLKNGNKIKSLCILEKAIHDLPYIKNNLQQYFLRNPIDCLSTAQILFIIAKVYYSLGDIFFVGFLKQCNDDFPDTAFEVCYLAWKEQPSQEILDFMLLCAEKCNIEGEMLPFLLKALQDGFASEEQIHEAYRLAEIYYDFDMKEQLDKRFARSTDDFDKK